MKYFKKLEGKRIYLSPMSEEDALIYTKWLNDFAVTDGLGCSHRLTSLNEEREWIIENSKKDAPQFAIVRKEDNALLGNCGFAKLNNIRQIGEIGIFIGEEENRNKGYGSEAVGLMVKFGFEYLNLNNIMLTAFSFNERAIRAYNKCGFREFGRRHNVITINNKLYDEVYMEILKEDYFQ